MRPPCASSWPPAATPAPTRRGNPIEGLDDAERLSRVTVFHAGTDRDASLTCRDGGRARSRRHRNRPRRPSARRRAYEAVAAHPVERRASPHRHRRRRLRLLRGSGVRTTAPSGGSPKATFLTTASRSGPSPLADTSTVVAEERGNAGDLGIAGIGLVHHLDVNVRQHRVAAVPGARELVPFTDPGARLDRDRVLLEVREENEDAASRIQDDVVPEDPAWRPRRLDRDCAAESRGARRCRPRHRRRTRRFRRSATAPVGRTWRSPRCVREPRSLARRSGRLRSPRPGPRRTPPPSRPRRWFCSAGMPLRDSPRAGDREREDRRVDGLAKRDVEDLRRARDPHAVADDRVELEPRAVRCGGGRRQAQPLHRSAAPGSTRGSERSPARVKIDVAGSSVATAASDSR